MAFPRRLTRCCLVVATTLLAAACGGVPADTTNKLPAADVPRPIGRGAAYRLNAISPAVAMRAPIAGMRCKGSRPRPFGAHLELYAHRLVLPLPAGIGVAPPQRRRGAYVLGGACLYAVTTFEPTGVLAIERGRTLTVGDLFAVWGQPLSANLLAGFRGPVLAFVGGRRWTRAPGAIPLGRHAQIVLEVGGYVAPHSTHEFPPGL